MRMGDLLSALLAVILLVGYFMILFRLVLDVFRRPDLSGWGRAGWFVALLALPLVALVAYLLVRGRSPNGAAGGA